jgi:hypothetical protein
MADESLFQGPLAEQRRPNDWFERYRGTREIGPAIGVPWHGQLAEQTRPQSSSRPSGQGLHRA